MRLIFASIFVLLVTSFVSGQEYRMVGKLPAPAMILTDMSGAKLNTRDFAGKVVVYNLWYVGCPPCMEEIPRLNAIVDAYPDVVFVGMSSSNAADITKFVTKHPFNYHIVPSAGKEMLLNFGNADNSGDLSVGFPTHVVINSDGYIEYRATGLKGVDGVRDALSRLAAKK